MDPSQYKSKELNLYSQDGTKRLHVKDNSVAFVFDYKDDQTGADLPISIVNQYVYFQGDNLPLTQALNELKQAVVDEAGAREDADHALEDTINEHYEEHVNAIDGVNQSVNSYVSSLSGSIGDVNNAVSYARNDFQNADTALGVRVDTEIFDRQGEISRVEQLIVDEVFIRTTGDNNILQSLTDEIGARTSAIETVQLSVVNEGKLRAAADTVLQGQIITLISGATSSTTEYKQLVLDEKKRAFDAEGLLSVAIADAKAEAEVALSTEAKARLDEDVKITASVEVEAKRAVEEEGKLSARIDFLTHNTSPVALDSLSELLQKFTQDGQTYQDRLTYLEGIVMALVNR
jgi:hypothetical protein